MDQYIRQLVKDGQIVSPNFNVELMHSAIEKIGEISGVASIERYTIFQDTARFNILFDNFPSNISGIMKSAEEIIDNSFESSVCDHSWYFFVELIKYDKSQIKKCIEEFREHGMYGGGVQHVEFHKLSSESPAFIVIGFRSFRFFVPSYESQVDMVMRRHFGKNSTWKTHPSIYLTIRNIVE